MARPRRILGELAARREWNTWTRRRSSSSATRTAREHNHGIARSPARPFEAAHPACAGLGGDLRAGLGPRPPRRPSTPGDTLTSSSLQAFQPAHDAAARGQPRFHEPGAGRLSPPDTSRRRSKAGGGALPRPDPLGHLSSRDRCGAGRRTRHRTPLGRSRPAHVLRSRLTGRPSRVDTRMWACVASARPAFARPASRTDPTPTACAVRAHLLKPAAPDCLHRPTPPGPRAASPELPRRCPGSAAPEVPSIDELPSR